MNRRPNVLLPKIRTPSDKTSAESEPEIGIAVVNAALFGFVPEEKIVDLHQRIHFVLGEIFAPTLALGNVVLTVGQIFRVVRIFAEQFFDLGVLLVGILALQFSVQSRFADFLIQLRVGGDHFPLFIEKHHFVDDRFLRDGQFDEAVTRGKRIAFHII